MDNNELLLALSNMLDEKLDKKLDEKLKSNLDPIKLDIEQIKTNQVRMGADIEELKAHQLRTDLNIENELRPNIHLLVENFIPAIKHYEKAASRIETLEVDVNLIKMVVAEHSEKLKKLA